jgi:hypothetical protein
MIRSRFDPSKTRDGADTQVRPYKDRLRATMHLPLQTPNVGADLRVRPVPSRYPGPD